MSNFLRQLTYHKAIWGYPKPMPLVWQRRKYGPFALPLLGNPPNSLVPRLILWHGADGQFGKMTECGCFHSITPSPDRATYLGGLVLSSEANDAPRQFRRLVYAIC